MFKRKTIASVLTTAALAGAAIVATPAAAIPNTGNGGNPAQSIFGLFGDCNVSDALGNRYEDPSCITHNTFKPVAGSNTDPLSATPAVGMYWDHGSLSDELIPLNGAPSSPTYPTSEMTFTVTFEYQPGIWIHCDSRLTPSGDYKSTCYFNAQSPKSLP